NTPHLLSPALLHPSHPVCRRPTSRGAGQAPGCPGRSSVGRSTWTAGGLVCSASPGSTAGGMDAPIPEPEAPAGGNSTTSAVATTFVLVRPAGARGGPEVQSAAPCRPVAPRGARHLDPVEANSAMVSAWARTGVAG